MRLRRQEAYVLASGRGGSVLWEEGKGYGPKEDADVASQLRCPCSDSQQCEEYGEMLSVRGRLGNSYHCLILQGKAYGRADGSAVIH